MLTETQRLILSKAKAECGNAGWASVHVAYYSSARALAARGLVKMTRPRGKLFVQATDAGTAALNEYYRIECLNQSGIGAL